MNYEKHYKLLCQSRQQLNRQKLKHSEPGYTYYELHHTIPKHENGSDEASNLVLLTAREHFIAHWLFAKWKRTRAAWAALAIFCSRCNAKSHAITSRQFEIARHAGIQSRTGRKRNEAFRLRMREISLGRNTGMKHTEATKQKIKEANIGKAFSEEHKANISASARKISRIIRIKVRLARKNLKLSTRAKLAQEYFALKAGFACELPKGGKA